MADYTEEESKVDIEEASVNLSCVKIEPDEVVTPEESLYITQYKITLEYENIFGGPSYKRDLEEYEDNLIGFIDNDAIMENVVIKLEGIKRENGNFNYCNNCNGDYKGYCIKCSSLSHILNNTVPLNYSKPEINTTPMDILEIRDTSMGKGVFLLKALPKNVVFGPFEGLSIIESTKGFGWKINNNRLVDIENGNWMKDIACTTNVSIKNLEVFQMEENLYFQANREILEGEELLVYFKDEEMQKSDENEECYFIPQKQQRLLKIFTCTRCCLGFSYLKCLVEHKNKCPYVEHKRVPKADFVLVECHHCKIWMEKQEHQAYHMDYCQKKSQRMSYCHSQSVDRNEVKVEEIQDSLKTKAICGEIKCPQYVYGTNYEENIHKDLNTHKSYECNICMINFTAKSSLKSHIKNKHTENVVSMKYQCSECSFQANYKCHYQRHLIRHLGVKPFECDVCKMTFNQKRSLKLHIKNKHTENGFAKDYQCPECAFQTNYKTLYQYHLNGHRGIKPFECGICQTKFTAKGSLKMHIKYQHAGDKNAKEYQCKECTYQTNYKREFQSHLNKHRGIKPFQCDICKMKFIQKSCLKAHIKNKHTSKDFQCSACSFQTNDKHRYQNHLNRHRGIKTCECDICKMQFTNKDDLQMHMKNKHTEHESAKDCSDFSFQTNDKYHYQRYPNRDIKEFECDTCKMKFYRKGALESHINRMHVSLIFLKPDHSDPNGSTVGSLYPVIYKNPTVRKK